MSEAIDLAAEAQLRAEALAQFLDTWQGEHSAFTTDELAKAAASLGWPASAVSRASGRRGCRRHAST